jgi:hypothetical protein
MRREAILAACVLALTGCGAAHSSTPAAAPSTSVHDQRQHFRDLKEGFLWSATLEAPGLVRTDGKTLMHAGQDVCSALSAGHRPAQSWAAFGQHYTMSAREKVAVARAAAGFLCPEYLHLIEPMG